MNFRKCCFLWETCKSTLLWEKILTAIRDLLSVVSRPLLGRHWSWISMLDVTVPLKPELLSSSQGHLLLDLHLHLDWSIEGHSNWGSWKSWNVKEGNKKQRLNFCHFHANRHQSVKVELFDGEKCKVLFWLPIFGQFCNSVWSGMLQSGLDWQSGVFKVGKGGASSWSPFSIHTNLLFCILLLHCTSKVLKSCSIVFFCSCSNSQNKVGSAFTEQFKVASAFSIL